MGMNHLGEIEELTKIAKPSIAVITNVGTAHIGNLGSRENILKAKLEILKGLREGGAIIINNDNDLLHNWYEQNKEKYNIITYGINNKSDIMPKEIEEKENGTIYKIDDTKIKVPVAGSHFVLNSLCAIAVGKVLKIDIENIAKGIEKFELTKKRMEIEKLQNNVTLINDSYNANYDSMKAAIEYLGNRKTRKIAVLGDMLELGEYAKTLHQKVGEEIVKNKIDILITVGELSKEIAKIAENKIEKIYKCENNEEAINIIKNIIKKEDTILLKASNSMNFSEIAESLK